MENLSSDGFTLTALFGGMLFVIWVLPGLICRKGKFPEDAPQRKRA